MSVVLRDSAASQKMHQDWVPVWRAKCKEFERKMKGFQVSVVLKDSASSQKMHQEWAPSMESKM